jgi:hypothetical protein
MSCFFKNLFAPTSSAVEKSENWHTTEKEFLVGAN